MHNFNGKVRGEYSVEVIRPTKVDTLEGKNLILNSFFSKPTLFTGASNYVVVGTNATPPQVTDTALLGFLSRSPVDTAQSTSITDEGAGIFTLKAVTQVTWAVGAVVGNLSELGLEYGSGNLVTRALMLDQSEQPTTISVTAEDQLIITYTMVLTIDANPVTVSEVIDGVTTDVTVHLVNLTKPSQNPWTAGGLPLTAEQVIRTSGTTSGSGILAIYAPVTIPATPGGTASPTTIGPPGSPVTTVEVANNTTRTIKIEGTIAASTATASPVGAVAVVYYAGATYAPQVFIEYDPPLNKTNLDQLKAAFYITLERAA